MNVQVLPCWPKHQVNKLNLSHWFINRLFFFLFFPIVAAQGWTWRPVLWYSLTECSVSQHGTNSSHPGRKWCPALCLSSTAFVCLDPQFVPLVTSLNCAKTKAICELSCKRNRLLPRLLLLCTSILCYIKALLDAVLWVPLPTSRSALSKKKKKKREKKTGWRQDRSHYNNEMKSWHCPDDVFSNGSQGNSHFSAKAWRPEYRDELITVDVVQDRSECLWQGWLVQQQIHYWK